MMTDDQLQLITAGIDGELPPAESRRLRRLLEASPEAREVHDRLKADSERLRKLPRVAPPADLAQRVMRRVAALTPPPARVPKAEPARSTPEPLPLSPRTWRAWVPAAVAACVLVGVAASSFYFFRTTNGPSNANRNPGGTPAPGHNAADPGWAKWLPSDTERPAAPPPREHADSAVVRNDTPGVTNPPVVPERTPVAPQPRSVQPDVFTAQPIPTPRFDHVEIRVPFLRSVADLDRAESRQELAEELRREHAFRIDVFARDTARAADVFQEAAKAAGLKVHADATTLDRLKKRQVTAVMVYTEALSAAEVAELFGRLSAADAKISPHVFDALHAIPASRADERTVVETLGRDPVLFKRADVEKRSTAGDPNKPISEGTAQHIVDRVTTSAAEKPAVLLSWAPPALRTAPAASAELKQFFAKRGDRRPSAVPVVIVIRPGNN